MALSLLEVFSNIPDHRRAEGKRFPLAPVLLYCVIAGANSYRQMHSFIAAHLGLLNAAFGTNLRCAPSYCGLRLILRGVDPIALEDAFRQHAQSLCAPQTNETMLAIAIDGKRLRGSFDGFSDTKAVHMLSALNVADNIVLAHVMIDEKSNEIPAAQALIEAPGLENHLFTLDAAHCQKNIFGGVGQPLSPADAGQSKSTQLAAQA